VLRAANAHSFPSLGGRERVDLPRRVGLSDHLAHPGTSWQAAGFEAIGAVIAVWVAYILLEPAKAQRALAAMGTPLEEVESVEGSAGIMSADRDEEGP
jgi:hypothetical protein